jgi:hypothetical protein
MEQRDALMAELPVIYARLYPGVGADRLTERVTEHIGADRAGTGGTP